MSKFGIGTRVRCVCPEGAPAWAVDGMTGVIVGVHHMPLISGDTGSWDGMATHWLVRILCWGQAPIPEERLEPLGPSDGFLAFISNWRPVTLQGEDAREARALLKAYARKSGRTPLEPRVVRRQLGSCDRRRARPGDVRGQLDYVGIELNPEYAALAEKRIGTAAAEIGQGGDVPIRAQLGLVS